MKLRLYKTIILFSIFGYSLPLHSAGGITNSAHIDINLNDIGGLQHQYYQPYPSSVINDSLQTNEANEISILKNQISWLKQNNQNLVRRNQILERENYYLNRSLKKMSVPFNGY